MGFRYTSLIGCRYLIDPDANKGTYIPDSTPSLAIMPSQDFRKWLIVSLDLELFMNPDLDKDLDYIPFGRCPFIGTVMVVDENGDVVETSGDIVYMAC